MLLIRTPLRVSFFGGGTDYPEYFLERRGSVLGMAIDKYIYIASIKMSGVQPYKTRIAYSKVEHVNSTSEIEHAVVRGAFKFYEITDPLDVSVMSDMPASSGLGSSSAFTVGLLNMIAAMRAEKLSKLDLAVRAIHVERELLGENVGVQDQLHTAFGGFNRFDFDAEGYKVTPMLMAGDAQRNLTDSMLLVHTGVTRHASKVVSSQLQRTRSGAIRSELDQLLDMVDVACSVIGKTSSDNLVAELGRLLHESWLLKRSLSPDVSMPDIDALYEKARRSGAVGGKLCGAGGGGFLLVLVPPHLQEDFIKKMSPATIVNIDIDMLGTSVLHA